MKAYTIEAPRQITPQHIEIPSLNADEVLVRVAYIGICGSDIHIYNGSYSGPFSYPLLFGHEWSGVVEAVGSGVTAFKPGDKVTGDCSRFCGVCGNCQIDRNLCSRIEKFGITTNGASAEFIVRSEKYLYKAPDDISLELLCLAEPLAVAYHLLNRINRAAPDIQQKNILIFGAGPIGISTLTLLKKLYACENVSVFEIVPNRRALAQKLGAHAPNPEELTVETGDSNYDALYSGLKYDVIIETTGVADVIADTVSLIKPMGIIGLLGMVPEVTINPKNIVVKALTIVGSIGGTGEFPAVINFINDQPNAVKSMSSHRFPINDAVLAFKTALKTEQAHKVLLHFEQP